MKSFWPIFLTFLLYAAACLFILDFFFLSNNNTQEVQSASIEDTTENINDQASLELDAITQEETILADEVEIDKISPSTIEEEEEKQEELITSKKEVTTPTPLKNDIETELYVAQDFAVYGKSNKRIIDCDAFATIYKNQTRVKIPYSCINYGTEIKKILETDETATLTITGYSSSEEPNSLGKQRADYVKKLLLGIGINSSRINTNGSFQNITFNNGFAKGGVYMKMQSSKTLTNTNATTVAIPVETNNFIPKSSEPYAYKKVTSGFQGDYFYGNQSFTSYINKVKAFLQQNPNKKISIYSHTTSVGNNTDNMQIAKANSITAKKIILQSGIPASKVKSYSMGEKPVDENGSSTCMIITVK